MNKSYVSTENTITMKKLKPSNNSPGLADIPELKWLRRFTAVSDSLFQIPGTKIRFGLDPILGLIPGLGDLLSGLVSSVLFLGVARYGVSGEVLVRMAGNIFLDYFIGNIPLIGDIFDFSFRANTRNFRLLEEHWGKSKYQGNGLGIVSTVIIILAIISGLLVYGLWRLIILLKP